MAVGIYIYMMHLPVFRPGKLALTILTATLMVVVPLWVHADLKKYRMIKEVGYDKVIVEDWLGTMYLVEYGIGCLSMWRYEGKYIYIEQGLFLDGISDTIHLLDSDDECRVWNAEQLDTSGSGFSSGSTYYVPPVAPVSTCPANASFVGGKCSCNTGFFADADKCVTATQHCQKTYGPNSYGDATNCYCNDGYYFGDTKDYCYPAPTPACPLNSRASGKSCLCDSGFVMHDGKCLSNANYCKRIFGEKATEQLDTNGNNSCACLPGYQLDYAAKTCNPFLLPTEQAPASPPVTERDRNAADVEILAQPRNIEDTPMPSTVSAENETKSVASEEIATSSMPLATPTVSEDDRESAAEVTESFVVRIWKRIVGWFR